MTQERSDFRWAWEVTALSLVILSLLVGQMDAAIFSLSWAIYVSTKRDMPPKHRGAST